jgi:hypothetical protein
VEPLAAVKCPRFSRLARIPRESRGKIFMTRNFNYLGRAVIDKGSVLWYDSRVGLRKVPGSIPGCPPTQLSVRSGVLSSKFLRPTSQVHMLKLTAAVHTSGCTDLLFLEAAWLVSSLKYMSSKRTVRLWNNTASGIPPLLRSACRISLQYPVWLAGAHGLVYRVSCLRANSLS